MSHRILLITDRPLFLRLVDGLGLHSTLSQYKVPQGDVPVVAERAVGKEDPMFPQVVQLLGGIYA